MIMVLFIVFLEIFYASCTPKVGDLQNLRELKENSKNENKNSIAKLNLAELNKPLREAIYFSNSLEREALKLILKDNSLQKLTLFSVLSYIVETEAGVKKATPYGLDCGKFNVNHEQKTIKIFKSCVKPSTEIAIIHVLEKDSLYEVEFLIKEWANIVGLSVTLTGKNVRCQLSVKAKKLNILKCDNWSYQTDSDQISATMVKTEEFLFQRDNQKQFVIKGGFFKELVENKKINIIVPIEGKIKIIEKELQIIDEFLNKINKENGEKNEKENAKESCKENSKEGCQENSKEECKESNKEACKENNKEVFEESNQEIDQKANGDQGQQLKNETSPEPNQRKGRGR